MSLRRFLGWEPAEFTEVVAFDEAGRPVRWKTRREPEWDDKQRLWMLALAHFESTLCRKCGYSLVDTTDPNTDPDNPQAAQQWLAEVPAECFCCKVLARSEKRVADDENNRIPVEALIHTAVLVAKKPQRRYRRRQGQPVTT